MSESKLQNIKALNQMLEGNHRLQTKKSIGFSDSHSTSEKNKKREVGETWEEAGLNGNVIYWTQHQGFRTKSNVSPEMSAHYDEIRSYLKTFPNCQKEGGCTCKVPSSLDQKFRRIVGMCHDCLVSFETKLKIQGKFNQYAMEKMKANAESFFKQADKEVEIIKESMKEVSFVNSEHGDVEKWEGLDSEKLIEKIDSDYATFKEKTLEKFEVK